MNKQLKYIVLITLVCFCNTANAHFSSRDIVLLASAILGAPYVGIVTLILIVLYFINKKTKQYNIIFWISHFLVLVNIAYLVFLFIFIFREWSKSYDFALGFLLFGFIADKLLWKSVLHHNKYLIDTKLRKTVFFIIPKLFIVIFAVIFLVPFSKWTYSYITIALPTSRIKISADYSPSKLCGKNTPLNIIIVNDSWKTITSTNFNIAVIKKQKTASWENKWYPSKSSTLNHQIESAATYQFCWQVDKEHERYFIDESNYRLSISNVTFE